MKKFFWILSIITVFLLTGCNSYKDVNNNLLENDNKQQITENSDDKQQITESNDDKQQVTESNDDKQQVTESNDDKQQVTENNDDKQQITENGDDKPQVTQNNDDGKQQVTQSNDDKQQVTQNNDDKPQVAKNDDGKQQITESNAASYSLQEAKIALFNALRDDDWVAENVSMKQTCFGEKFTEEQNLWFEKLRDDLVIVQAHCNKRDYDSDTNVFSNINAGVQLFLVGYKDGEIKVTSLSKDLPEEPGHVIYNVDKENLTLLVEDHGKNLNSLKYVAYNLSNLTLEEVGLDEIVLIESEEYYPDIGYPNGKYTNFTQIETELTDANLHKEFFNIDITKKDFTSSFTSKEARTALFNALTDDSWIAENVLMKQTCLGEEFTEKQVLGFTKLRDDLVIVKAYCYTDNNYGVQLFFVKYQDGNISVASFPENLPADPRNERYTIATGINFSERIPFLGIDYSAVTDIGPLFLLKKCYNTDSIKFTAYKINDLSLEEVDNGICLYPGDSQYVVYDSFSGKEYYGSTTVGFADLTTDNLLKYFKINN